MRLASTFRSLSRTFNSLSDSHFLLCKTIISSELAAFNSLSDSHHILLEKGPFGIISFQFSIRFSQSHTIKTLARMARTFNSLSDSHML